MTIKNINQHFFDNWNENSCYVIGFFLADGNICKSMLRYRANEIERKRKEEIDKIKRKPGPVINNFIPKPKDSIEDGEFTEIC